MNSIYKTMQLIIKNHDFFRLLDETKVTPKHESGMIREAPELDATTNDSGPMFEFDDDPPINKRDENMEFVEYPQSPNARSKSKLNCNFK